MTDQQKNALKEARSPKRTRTSEEAYAQMDRMMGTRKFGTGAMTGMGRNDNGAPTTGRPPTDK